MDESALAIILQDINPKDIKIYNKNKLLIELFKNHFGKEISNLVQLETTDFIKTIYQDIEHIFTNKNLTTILERNFNQTDLYHIKESLYNIDFRISKAYYQENKKQHENQSLFDGNTLLEIYAQHKETLL
ncbi:TPA: hypothetical protein DIC40_05060 [Patescibacteria group bacterium]|nr:hypothetical protein [Candidatus Gracilibacteria bacterium]